MEINSSQKRLLESEAVALATVNKNGSPNVIPVAYLKVVDFSKIIITDNFMKTTNKNIKRDPRVCLSVWSKDWEEGYKFIGEASYQTQGEWAQFVRKMEENKGLSAKGAIIVSVKEINRLA